MVVTKIRPSGDLAMNRTRFNPSAAGTIVKSAGSINENGFFPFKRTACAVNLTSVADWEEQSDDIVATNKTAVHVRKILFMNKIVPSKPRGVEVKLLSRIKLAGRIKLQRYF
jgi:hypothetical protein